MVAATGTGFFEHLEDDPSARGRGVPRGDGSRRHHAGGGAEPRPRLGRHPAGVRRRWRHRRRAPDAHPAPTRARAAVVRPTRGGRRGAARPAVGGRRLLRCRCRAAATATCCSRSCTTGATPMPSACSAACATPCLRTPAAIVVENVLPDRPRDEFVVASDLLMLVLGPGRERTRAQFDALFAEAGLTLARHVVLPDRLQRVRARPGRLTAFRRPTRQRRAGARRARSAACAR